ncbi:MAG: sigma-54-dependent Fis family transcriptional regulator [Myxococcales bacterium]|nr:sigma-54-dependent Fis family transcriptional regulator [Myxococcales bacterium]
MRILVVDDQRSARRLLCHMLAAVEGAEILEAASLAEARAAVEEQNPDLLLVDIRLGESPTDRGGLELMSWLRGSGYATPAVMVTAFSEVAEIREAMRQGASDYVFKDELSPEMLLPIVNGIAERARLLREVGRLRKNLDARFGTGALVGSSPEMERVRLLVERVAGSDCSVLLRGQTGTGKELVARTLHQLGTHADAPFVAVNCSALPGTLVESILFGHERGAFSGADRRVRGQLELAGSGTVLLDEIAEMPPELQAKLLRVLEDRRFRPIGAERETPLRARILAATHVDLEERIRDGRFREDLFYRLNVVSIALPSLAGRGGDIRELLASLLPDLRRRLSFSPDAVEWLAGRPWPGNVRELKNALIRVALLSDTDHVDAKTLQELVGESARNSGAEVDGLATRILALPAGTGSKLDSVELAVLQRALELSSGNKSAAARLVGLERKAFERRWERGCGRPPDSGDDPSG